MSMIVLLSLSVLIVLSTDSLLFMWVCMEVNSLVTNYMLIKSSKSDSFSLKFLFYQSLSGNLIVFSILLSSDQLFLVGILMKAAMPPMHWWVIDFIPNMSYSFLGLFLGPLKVVPMAGLASAYPSMSLMVVCVLYLFGGIMGSSISMKSLLFFNSILSLLWIFCFIKSSSGFWVSYMLWHSLLLMYLASSLSSPDSFSMVAMLALAGFPPMYGFMLKVKAVVLASEDWTFMPIMLLLILSSLAIFYFLMQLMTWLWMQPNEQVKLSPLLLLLVMPYWLV